MNVPIQKENQPNFDAKLSSDGKSSSVPDGFQCLVGLRHIEQIMQCKKANLSSRKRKELLEKFQKLSCDQMDFIIYQVRFYIVVIQGCSQSKKDLQKYGHCQFLELLAVFVKTQTQIFGSMRKKMYQDIRNAEKKMQVVAKKKNQKTSPKKPRKHLISLPIKSQNIQQNQFKPIQTLINFFGFKKDQEERESLINCQNSSYD